MRNLFFAAALAIISIGSRCNTYRLDQIPYREEIAEQIKQHLPSPEEYYREVNSRIDRNEELMHEMIKMVKRNQDLLKSIREERKKSSRPSLPRLRINP